MYSVWDNVQTGTFDVRTQHSEVVIIVGIRKCPAMRRKIAECA